MARLEHMTTDELYTALQEIDATPRNGSERQEQALQARADRIERELELREEDESDPWSHENHHD